MRDLYLRRNELSQNSQRLKVIKFDPKFSVDKVKSLVDEQTEVWKRFKFYDNFIKVGGKIYGEQIRSKKK